MGTSKSLARRTVAIDRTRGAFDNPAARQDCKADGTGHTSHDLDAPVAEFGMNIGETVRAAFTL
jgi:hypothetical protein